MIPSTKIYKRLDLGEGVWVEARCMTGVETLQMMDKGDIASKFEYVAGVTIRAFGGICGDDGNELGGDGLIFLENATLGYVDKAVAQVIKMSNIGEDDKKK